MVDRADNDFEAMQRAYLVKHQATCRAQIFGPRSDHMTHRARQLIFRYSRKFGFPVK